MLFLVRMEKLKEFCRAAWAIALMKEPCRAAAVPVVS
jgi:hypothetical protein